LITTDLHLVNLYPYQKEAVSQLKTGSILCGGVGSGKTRTSLAYYFENERPKDLYVITTAKKRDTLDWERESALFMLTKDRTGIDGVQLTVDSWNNIKKYIDVKKAFFIFDEQRVIGSGAWVKSFLKIVKENNWILLSATPGDTWMDYIPVFIANGFYKNRTQFIQRHVVYYSYLKFPKIKRYLEEDYLNKLKNHILVTMDYIRPTKVITNYINVEFDKDKYNLVIKKRWNPYDNKPIRNSSQYFYLMRRVVNSDNSRMAIIFDLIKKHSKLIVFYNFDYELDILRKFEKDFNIPFAEYNGHKHEAIPNEHSWLYAVQYLAGSESWNCTETNVIAFYSLNYSYRITSQASGRIDRLNTPFTKLYYYMLISNSSIDKAILLALKNKKNFNEKDFLSTREKHRL